MEDEINIIRDNIKEFSSKNLDEKEIEANGLNNMLEKLSAQGIINGTIESKYGGLELDKKTGMAIIEEVSKYSPSAAFYSYITGIYIKAVSGSEIEDTSNDIAAGKKTASISFSYKNNDNKIYDVFFLSNENALAVIDNDLYYVSGKYEIRDSLGFKGLKFGDMEIEKKTKIGESESFFNAVRFMDPELCSMSLGLMYGSIEKAFEYSKIRSLFNTKIKDFGPVAYTISDIMSRLEIARHYLYSNGKIEFAKNFISSMLVDVTRTAVNIHGGYGFFVDFGIEKYYRDAVTLKSMLFMNIKNELSNYVYGDKAGFI
ncbi:acyl-CoA dehydrogenase family protein [Picrophilus oshimae]|uniref:Acyl-CoA dehydrogenase n=1 Tax=Picrophilus torridus (strain ATCC 700027 / DSM 9790 / JCM 10055 / NBRC 100828 / KAW 2/3) TaxID=1122961 RepID=Q6L092_PICTO|nr:acyl-CoA dehydrogenase family protein [Picrophilus oshimae]AAT43610.1 acyl-CoA dehydrogenase, short-chain specific [Picrophilus oshimae DSM 9789]SMD31237.1 Acyl-CoA dehydrogenase [Picrophilus oshimae DSM 9789]